MSTSFSPKERVFSIINKECTNLAAAITPTSVANISCMQLTGSSFPQVHTNSDKMASLAAAGYEILGFDSIAPYFGIHQEAAALGCKINWGTTSSMPAVLSNPIHHPDDFRMPEDFLDRTPIKTVLDAISILHQKYKDKVVIIGKVMGPWTLAYHLYGVQQFLMDTVLSPERVRGFLTAFQNITLTFALAQVEAGADIITWADHVTGDLVSTKTYLEYLYPVHRDLIRKFRNSTPRYVPLILHTCGYTLDRVYFFSKAGFDIFHFDSKNNPTDMLIEVGDRMMLTGCVNNPNLLLNGTRVSITTQVNSILSSGIKLISPECAIPTQVKNANLAAIVKTVHRFNSK